MKFRNYCIVVLGEVAGVKIEIEKIAETTPNILDSKGILIATFSSLAEPNELEDWFIENKRSFLLFDLSKECSGYNITKKHIHEGLFGFLKDMNMGEMTDNFFKAVKYSSETTNINVKTSHEKSIDVLTLEKINKMTREEKAKLLDEILDYGVDKLTENDKKLLPLLST